MLPTSADIAIGHGEVAYAPRMSSCCVAEPLACIVHVSALIRKLDLVYRLFCWTQPLNGESAARPGLCAPGCPVVQQGCVLSQPTKLDVQPPSRSGVALPGVDGIGSCHA
jgi:hypothetical protein